MTGLHLQKHGLTDKGYKALCREGTTISSKTMRNFSKTKVFEHQNIVKKLIDEAIEKSELMTVISQECFRLQHVSEQAWVPHGDDISYYPTLDQRI